MMSHGELTRALRRAALLDRDLGFLYHNEAEFRYYVDLECSMLAERLLQAHKRGLGRHVERDAREKATKFEPGPELLEAVLRSINRTEEGQAREM